jgi:hypothetical protein
VGRKIWLAIISIIFVGLLGYRFLLYQNRNLSEKDLTIDIQTQVSKTIKPQSKININNVDVKIELFEDVLDKRFIVYSFNNPMLGYRHGGYAIYEIKQNGKFERIDLGWSNTPFNAEHLNVKQDGKEQKYLVVYGNNKASEKQVYKYVTGKEERIEEFRGDYFLKKYPIDENPISFTGVN